MPLMYTEKGFLKAATTGKLDLVEAYLARPGHWLTLKDQNNQNALHLALDNNQTDVALRLIAAGAPLEEHNRYDWTPLYLATLRSNTKAVTALLAAGANVNALVGSENVLSAVVQSRKLALAEVLLAAGADASVGTPLVSAIYHSQTQIAQQLVAAGASISKADNYGRTPLSIAVQQGSAEMVTLVLDNGADINARDNSGYSALHHAAAKNAGLIAEILISRGANTELKTNDGETAYKIAKERRNDAVSSQLVEKKKHVDRSKQGTENWERLGDARIAYTGIWPALERKITEIFNFEARERVTITENLRNGAEHISRPQSFDTLGEKAIERALAEFRSRGGSANDDVFTPGASKNFKTLPGV